MQKKKSFLSLTGIIIFFASWILPLSASAEDINQLKEAIQSLKEENRALREKLETQEALLQKLMDRLSALEVKEIRQVGMEKGSMLSSGLPEMKVKGFADIGLEVKKIGDADSNEFKLGEFDFIVTSSLTDRINFFSETIIEFEESETEVDVERLYLKYNVSEFLKILAGRIHTPLGHWNTYYHHGKWFQTTDARPLLMEYEHTSGLLPLHTIGIGFEGKKDVWDYNLGYNFGISNGRDDMRTHIQNIQDKNDSKAFFAQLSLGPNSIPGLKLIFSSYIDKIPPLAGTADREGDIDEVILGGSIVYERNKLELILEGFEIQHDDEVSQRDYDTTGFYLQMGYRLKERWMPYYRFDFLDFAQGDPYYSGIDIDTQKHTFGLRWNLATWVALKLEYSYSGRKNTSDEQSITLNNSFHF